MLPPYPRNLPPWWKEEYDDLLIYGRHSCMIPAARRSDMSLIHQAIRSLFNLRLTSATIRGVEERYGQIRALAPWMLDMALRKNYGWTNEPVWHDLLATTAFSIEDQSNADRARIEGLLGRTAEEIDAADGLLILCSY